MSLHLYFREIASSTSFVHKHDESDSYLLQTGLTAQIPVAQQQFATAKALVMNSKYKLHVSNTIH